MVTDINDFIRKSESKVEIARQNGRKCYYFMGIEFPKDNRNLFTIMFMNRFEDLGYRVFDITQPNCRCQTKDILVEF